ncbi:GalT Galactose-1-phosphate uridylyltransferase [Acidimicrobiia bacterium]
MSTSDDGGTGSIDRERSAGGHRIDPLTGTPTHIVAHRQDRPNLPDGSCPFCVGGSEAPDPYDVRAFANRWPPLPDGRAEIVLYAPDHDASFADLSTMQARKVVDLWAERSTELGARDDVSYVLVFENRGSEVGATIAHPHGQIYAFADVPPAALVEFVDDGMQRGFDAEAIGNRLVSSIGDWAAWVPSAAGWPYELLLAPRASIPDLPSLDDASRDSLGELLVDIVSRLDRLFAAPMPFMMWIHQRPFDNRTWPDARVHLHVAPLLRSPGTARFVAAGELGSGVWFNPVEPEVAAAELRALST